MKGSVYRKRYILIWSDRMPEVLPSLEKDMFSLYRAKRKFAEGNYAIILTNQFNRDEVLARIHFKFSGVETLITSGTIKKCKNSMKKHQEEISATHREISTFLQQ